MPAGMHPNQPKFNPRQQYRTIQNSYRNKLKSVGQAHVAEREKLVRGWTNRPQFAYKITGRRTQFIIEIVVTNSSRKVRGSTATVGELWAWWEFTGVPPHLIMARRGGMLMFMPRGSSKFIFRPFVRHPGYRAHGKTEAINNRINGRIPPLLTVGIREGYQQA